VDQVRTPASARQVRRRVDAPVVSPVQEQRGGARLFVLAYNLRNFVRRLTLAPEMANWSLKRLTMPPAVLGFHAQMRRFLKLRR